MIYLHVVKPITKLTFLLRFVLLEFVRMYEHKWDAVYYRLIVFSCAADCKVV